MKWERWHGFVAIGLLAAAGMYALARSDGKSTANDVADAAAGHSARRPPRAISSPSSTSARPNATWTKLQRGIGGAVGILPATMPGVIVALSDLDPVLGERARRDGADLRRARRRSVGSRSGRSRSSSSTAAARAGSSSTATPRVTTAKTCRG